VKLLTEIALSTTESEYISLSAALREVIRFYVALLKIIQAPLDGEIPKDGTKNKKIKYHHFREEVNKRNIIIEQVDTLGQQADIFTKPLGNILFRKSFGN
jgi:hypothetical protein